MKAVSPLVGFVLTIFITIMITTLTFTVIKPTLERNRGFNVINEASVNLELLSSAINEVATEAEGSKRTITLSVSDGEYLIDKNSNNIIFTFEPSIDLGVIGRIGDKFLEKGLVFFDFFNNYLDNSFPKNLINVSGSWRVYNNRLEGINGTAYYFIDKNLNGFYVSSNFGSNNNLGEIFVSPVNLSGLVLYLTFDEGSGNIVYDYSGNRNNGTLYNGSIVCSNPPTSGCPTWIDGKFGKALQFDGVDDYVLVPSLNGLSSLPLTLELWLKMISINPTASQCPIGQRYVLYIQNSANKYDLAGVAQDTASNYRYVVITSDWRVDYGNNFIHVVMILEPTNLTVYANGVYKGSVDATSGYSFKTPNKLYVGAIDGICFANAIIDEVRIYNRALTDDEIKFLYQEGLKKLQNSGMIQFNSQIKPYIAISNPSGKIYVENLRVGNQNSKEIKLIKPFYNLEFNSNFRFSKGNHQIKIENIGFNSTSKRPIIRISES